MFDLEQQIRVWRSSLAKKLRGPTSTLDELEDHLRHAVESGIRSGSTPEQAWETALSRLGASDPLAAEFRKLSPFSALSWLPAQVMMGLHAAFAIWLAWAIPSRLAVRQDVLLGLHVFFLTVGYTAVFAVGVIAVWSIVSRAVRGWSEKEQRSLRSAIRGWTAGGLALTLLGFVLGSFWARGQWGRFWSWDPKELAAITLLGWNGLVLILLVWRPSNEKLAMLLGLAGNAVVTACWFGPAVLGLGSHSYGSASIVFFGVLTAIVVTAALGLTWLALLPQASLRRQTSIPPGG